MLEKSNPEKQKSESRHTGKYVYARRFLIGKIIADGFHRRSKIHPANIEDKVSLHFKILQINSAKILDMKSIGHYVQEIWQAKEGLPQNSAQAIVPTRDGYVWIGTQDGLARFDGVRFAVWNKENTREIKHNNIRALHESRGGGLWVGTDAGLGFYQNGEWVSYGLSEKLSCEIVSSICEGRDGKIWIGTWGGGLNCLENGAIKTFAAAEGLSNDFIAAVHQDKAGKIWIGTYGGGLNCFEDGKFVAYTTREGLSHDRLRSILEDRDGNLWIGTRGGGLNLFRDGKFTAFGAKDGLLNDSVWSLFEDRDGALWIGTYGGGLYRYKNGKFTTFAAEDGLSDNFVWSIAEDREGGLWVGTGGGGLNRLQDGNFVSLNVRDGLVHNIVWSLFEDAQANLWVGTYGGGLSCLQQNGECKSYTTDGGDLPNNFVEAICGDSDSGVWIGTDGGGLSRFAGGEWMNLTTENGLSNNAVSALFCDAENALWIGTKGGGLNRLQNGSFTVFTAKDGLSNNFVRAICADGSGGIWIGTRGGGLSHFKENRWTNYTTENGLSHNVIFSLYLDAEKTLWICTGGGGLNRFRDGRFTAFTTANGLFHDSPFCVLEDGSGNLWLSSTKGVFCVGKKELEEFAEGKRPHIVSKFFGEEDGMKSSECNGGFQSAGLRLRDDRLCFPTIKGVAIVNPQNLKINNLPPPVVIEKVIINKREIVASADKIVISPGSGELEFQYAGLSFISPKKVRFKYKLEGFDQDWIDAGTRRAAFYTNIPPGDYSFRVTACNSDAVWNESGAAFDFTLEPHFYQTKSFFSLCAAAVGGATVAAFKWRVRLMKKREEELVELVEKRTFELAEANRALQKISVLDALTGVANRRKFDEVLETEWRRAIRSNALLSVILIDVDFFKSFNDHYGHQAGDECLRRVAKTLDAVINRAGDILARYGGEEFVVVLQGNTAQGAAQVAEILRRRIESLQIPHGTNRFVTISLGAATLAPKRNLSSKMLVAAADKALYRAKENGRNRVEVDNDANFDSAVFDNFSKIDYVSRYER